MAKHARFARMVYSYSKANVSAAPISFPTAKHAKPPKNAMNAKTTFSLMLKTINAMIVAILSLIVQTVLQPQSVILVLIPIS
jgi:hypothetical protein